MKLPKSLLKWTILLAATTIVIVLCWLMLRPFMDVIAWSVILVITFYPVHQHLATRTGRPSLSALLSCLLVVLTILIPVLVVSAVVVSEFLSLRDSLLSKFNDGFDLNGVEPVRVVMDWVSRFLKLDLTKVGEWIRQHASDLAQTAGRYSLTFAGNVSSLIVSFCFTVFTMFFLFRDGAHMVANIPDFLPLERSESEALIKRIRDVIDGSIYGVLVIALIQGGLGGLMFWFLTIPSSVMWGLVMAVASLIPLFGTASVWIPGAGYLLLTGDWGKAIILAAFGAVVISSVDNFLRPKLVGDRVKLNELVMFFSVLGGLDVFGVLGIVAGPVVFAIAGTLLDTLRRVETVRDEAKQAPTSRTEMPT